MHRLKGVCPFVTLPHLPFSQAERSPFTVSFSGKYKKMQLPQHAIVWEVELTCLLDTIAAPTWTEEVRLPADRPDQSYAVAHHAPIPLQDLEEALKELGVRGDYTGVWHLHAILLDCARASIAIPFAASFMNLLWKLFAHYQRGRQVREN